MSERSPFSYRYVVPGFVFILQIFLVNLNYVLNSVSESFNASAVVAVLVFLSSPAFGFIISQGWYVLFDKYFIDCHTRWRERLIDKSIIKRENKIIEGDYWLYLKSETKLNKRLWSYLIRRLDIFHALGSTAFVLFTGPWAGLIIELILPNLFEIKDYRIHWSLFLSILIVSKIAGALCLVRANKVKKEQDDMLLKIVDGLLDNSKQAT